MTEIKCIDSDQVIKDSVVSGEELKIFGNHAIALGVLILARTSGQSIKEVVQQGLAENNDPAYIKLYENSVAFLRDHAERLGITEFTEKTYGKN